jgi:hypothetical protein
MPDARDFPWPPPRAGHTIREDLEALLLPLVRHALRGRAGLPALADWVRRNLNAPGGGSPPDPERAAPRLARLLGETLLRRRAGAADGPGGDTVRGP